MLSPCRLYTLLHAPILRDSGWWPAMEWARGGSRLRLLWGLEWRHGWSSAHGVSHTSIYPPVPTARGDSIASCGISLHHPRVLRVMVKPSSLILHPMGMLPLHSTTGQLPW
jgi:hypothetical protein